VIDPCWLDDGAQTIEDSVSMARSALADGIRTVPCPPARVGPRPNLPLWLRATRDEGLERRTLCVEPAGRGMTRLVIAQPGRFALRALENTIRLFETLLDSDRTRCSLRRG
jgi:hypothetical protein